jgi:RHS repeat-associated protein
MQMPGRKFSNGSGYRYGFNGKENDNEVKGEGNQQDYGMRIYDPRLGKFLSVDPLSKDYPWNSTYAFAENDVIRNTDLDGAEKFPYKHPNRYPVLGKVSRYNTAAGNDASTYKIADGEESYLVSKVTVYEQCKDAFGRIHHFNNYYFVQDKSLVNENDVVTGGGSTVKSKGTNWHLYLSDYRGMSTESKVSQQGVRALAMITAGGITAAAAAPALVAAAPIIGNGFNFAVKTYGKDFVINTAKQYFSNKGDVRKMDWFDISVSTLNPFKKLGVFSGAANETLNSLVDIKNWQITTVGFGKSGADAVIDFTFGQIKSLGKTTFSTLTGDNPGRDYFWDIGLNLFRNKAKEIVNDKNTTDPPK